MDSKKTKNVGDKMRRFGEAGDDVDNGLVDSAFTPMMRMIATWKRRIRNVRCVASRRKKTMNRGD